MGPRKQVREGVLLAEALVGLAVALLLLMGLCTMLQQWRRGASALERRAVLIEQAMRAMRTAAREDFEVLAKMGTSGVVSVGRTEDEQVLRVRVEIVEAPVRVVLERLVARPEASLSMEGTP